LLPRGGAGGPRLRALETLQLRPGFGEFRGGVVRFPQLFQLRLRRGKLCDRASTVLVASVLATRGLFAQRTGRGEWASRFRRWIGPGGEILQTNDLLRSSGEPGLNLVGLPAAPASSDSSFATACSASPGQKKACYSALESRNARLHCVDPFRQRPGIGIERASRLADLASQMRDVPGEVAGDDTGIVLRPRTAQGHLAGELERLLLCASAFHVTTLPSRPQLTSFPSREKATQSAPPFMRVPVFACFLRWFPRASRWPSSLLEAMSFESTAPAQGSDCALVTGSGGHILAIVGVPNGHAAVAIRAGQHLAVRAESQGGDPVVCFLILCPSSPDLVE